MSTRFSVQVRLNRRRSLPRTERPGPWARRSMAIPDDMLYEVVDGKIVEKIVGVYEADIATLLIEFLAPFVRSASAWQGLRRDDLPHRSSQEPPAPAGCLPSCLTLAGPCTAGHPVAVWDMVPDLAIEVVSPSNSADQVQEKIHEYFKAGVTRVWVVYPGQQEVYVYASPTQIQVLQLGQELDGGDLVPGFRLPLAALFEDDAE